MDYNDNSPHLLLSSTSTAEILSGLCKELKSSVLSLDEVEGLQTVFRGKHGVLYIEQINPLYNRPAQPVSGPGFICTRVNPCWVHKCRLPCWATAMSMVILVIILLLAVILASIQPHRDESIGVDEHQEYSSIRGKWTLEEPASAEGKPVLEQSLTIPGLIDSIPPAQAPVPEEEFDRESQNGLIEELQEKPLNDTVEFSIQLPPSDDDDYGSHDLTEDCTRGVACQPTEAFEPIDSPNSDGEDLASPPASVPNFKLGELTNLGEAATESLAPETSPEPNSVQDLSSDSDTDFWSLEEQNLVVESVSPVEYFDGFNIENISTAGQAPADNQQHQEGSNYVSETSLGESPGKGTARPTDQASPELDDEYVGPESVPTSSLNTNYNEKNAAESKSGDGHHGSQKLFQNQADRATVNRDADVPAYAIVDDLEDSEDDTNNTSDMFESTVLAASPISAKESLDKEFKYVNVKDGQALGEEIILSPYVSKRPDEIVEVVDWDLEEYYVYKDSNPLEASSPSQEYPKQLYNTLEFLEGGPLDDSIEKTKMNNFIGSMDDTSSQAQESQDPDDMEEVPPAPTSENRLSPRSEEGEDVFDSMSADHNFHLDKVILEERRSEHPSAAPGFKPNSPSESQASEYIYPEEAPSETSYSPGELPPNKFHDFDTSQSLDSATQHQDEADLELLWKPSENQLSKADPPSEDSQVWASLWVMGKHPHSVEPQKVNSIFQESPESLEEEDPEESDKNRKNSEAEKQSYDTADHEPLSIQKFLEQENGRFLAGSPQDEEELQTPEYISEDASSREHEKVPWEENLEENLEENKEKETLHRPGYIIGDESEYEGALIPVAAPEPPYTIRSPTSSIHESDISGSSSVQKSQIQETLEHHSQDDSVTQRAEGVDNEDVSAAIAPVSNRAWEPDFVSDTPTDENPEDSQEQQVNAPDATLSLLGDPSDNNSSEDVEGSKVESVETSETNEEPQLSPDVHIGSWWDTKQGTNTATVVEEEQASTGAAQTPMPAKSALDAVEGSYGELDEGIAPEYPIEPSPIQAEQQMRATEGDGANSESQYDEQQGSVAPESSPSVEDSPAPAQAENRKEEYADLPQTESISEDPTHPVGFMISNDKERAPEPASRTLYDDADRVATKRGRRWGPETGLANPGLEPGAEVEDQGLEEAPYIRSEGNPPMEQENTAAPVILARTTKDKKAEKDSAGVQNRHSDGKWGRWWMIFPILACGLIGLVLVLYIAKEKELCGPFASGAPGNKVIPQEEIVSNCPSPSAESTSKPNKSLLGSEGEQVEGSKMESQEKSLGDPKAEEEWKENNVDSFHIVDVLPPPKPNPNRLEPLQLRGSVWPEVAAESSESKSLPQEFNLPGAVGTITLDPSETKSEASLLQGEGSNISKSESASHASESLVSSPPEKGSDD